MPYGYVQKSDLPELRARFLEGVWGARGPGAWRRAAWRALPVRPQYTARQTTTLAISMTDSSSAMWKQRFGADARFHGTDPNEFLRASLPLLTLVRQCAWPSVRTRPAARGGTSPTRASPIAS